MANLETNGHHDKKNSTKTKSVDSVEEVLPKPTSAAPTKDEGRALFAEWEAAREAIVAAELVEQEKATAIVKRYGKRNYEFRGKEFTAVKIRGTESYRLVEKEPEDTVKVD